MKINLITPGHTDIYPDKTHHGHIMIATSSTDNNLETVTAAILIVAFITVLMGKNVTKNIYHVISSIY